MKIRPLVAIVGRPNVGKSTLFNRLVGDHRAAVHAMPGMTRDRHYAEAIYRMRPYTVIDTGGYEDSTASTLLQQMRVQSIAAIDEADAVIFLTTVTEPNDPVDLEILERLRSSGKPFFLAVNKIDKGRMLEAQAYADFSGFGLDEIYPVSGQEGSGVYDLMDAVTAHFEQWDPDEIDLGGEALHVAIVGRQNVGKSSLLNRLFGEERVIANPEGGTTRDAIDAEVSVNGQRFVVIDTAGIRRRGKIERGPEALSVHSSFRAIDRAHVVLLVVDGKEGMTAQDAHIAGYVLERRRACIICVNKWDLVEDREKAYSKTIQEVRRHFNFMTWAPILTVSALTGQRTHKIWDLVTRCAENFRRRFTTSELNLILKKATAHVSPPTHKGNAVSLKYVVQSGATPPVLSFFVNNPKGVHFSYRRYLANQFMMQLGLEGTPLFLRFRAKAAPRGWDPNARLEWDAERRPKRMLDAKGTFFGGAYNDEGENIDINTTHDQLFDEYEGEEIVQMYIIDGEHEDQDDGDDDE
jgi:GTP-binding protein